MKKMKYTVTIGIGTSDSTTTTSKKKAVAMVDSSNEPATIRVFGGWNKAMPIIYWNQALEEHCAEFGIECYEGMTSIPTGCVE